ncbi:hypothetical protein RJ641_011041 [Dillenia turbinata]|uniref:Uncharacterized protein n=1 Tax=Dillenia turbinata TaxID=194707 RepID=A0AAN8V8U8_9MAGN
MMNVSIKGSYDTETKSTVTGTVRMTAGDVNLRVSDEIFVNRPTLNSLALSRKTWLFPRQLQRPRKVRDLANADLMFRFMNTTIVSDKPLNLSYTHWRGKNLTVVDGTLVIDSGNKMSARYELESGNCKLKYSHDHNGVRTIEPCYDLKKNTWDLAISQRVSDDDLFVASYATSTKVLGLEWMRNSKINGAFKV